MGNGRESATWDENGDVMYTLVGESQEACAPDARLIAAAPKTLEQRDELLDVAMFVEEVLDCAHDLPVNVRLDLARERLRHVIDKARGTK